CWRWRPAVRSLSSLIGAPWCFLRERAPWSGRLHQYCTEIRNFYAGFFIVPAQKSAIKAKISIVLRYNNDDARTKVISHSSECRYRCTCSSTTSRLLSHDTGPSCTPGKVALDAETGQIVRRVPKTAGQWGVGVSVCDLRQEHHWGIQRA